MRIDLVCHGKTQACDVVWGCAICNGANVIKTRGERCADEERSPLFLHHFTDGIIHPEGNPQLFGNFHRLLADRLPQTQRHARRRVGHIFAQD